MAFTYSQYDSSRPHGLTAATATDHFMSAIASFRNLWDVVTAATNGGADTTKLIGGDFGCLDAANATDFYQALYSINYVLEGATLNATGIYGNVASLSKGSAFT